MVDAKIPGIAGIAGIACMACIRQAAELEVPPRWCEDFGCRPSFADWHLAVMS